MSIILEFLIIYTVNFKLNIFKQIFVELLESAEVFYNVLVYFL
jgi:hypothetical protein